MNFKQSVEAQINIKENICFIKVKNKTFCFPLKTNNGRLSIVKELMPNFQEQLLQFGYLQEKVYEFMNFLYLYISNYGISLMTFKKIISECNLEKLDYEYDDVYLINSNSGEASIFLAYLAKAFIKKNKSKTPLFVATQPYLVDIVKMYFPDANVINEKLYYKFIDNNITALGDSWFLDGHKYYIVYSREHFNKVNRNLGEVHFIEQMLKTLGLTTEDFSKPEFFIDSETKSTVLDKMKKLQLNLDRFVVLAPEAMTYRELPQDFWQSLIDGLQNNGYDVFLNTMKPHSYRKVKSIPLSLSEIFHLTTLSKGLISLRSGISDFLLPTNVPIISLTTDIPWSKKSSKEQLKAYTLMETPFINKNLVKEVDVIQYAKLDSTILVKDLIDILGGYTD